MASIKEKHNKDGSTSFLIEVFCGREPSGKKIIKRTTFRPTTTAPKKAMKEAEKYAAQYEAQVLSGDIVSGDKITFCEMAQIWEENWLPAKTPSVQENYKDILRLHVIPVIGHLKITAIKAPHIDAIMQTAKDENKAASTIRDQFTVINSVFKYAYKKQFIRENPCQRCDERPPVKMKTGKDIQFFNIEQTRRFIREALTMEYDMAFPERSRKSKKTSKTYNIKSYTIKRTVHIQWRIYFMMAIWGTFRRGEMCALTWNDIDEKKHSFSINKAAAMTKKTKYIKGPKTEAGIRDLTMPDEIFVLMREWKKMQLELCMKLGSAWKGHRNIKNEDGTQDSFDENTIFIDTRNGLPIHLSTPNHKFHEVCNLYNTTREKEEEKLPWIRLHDL